MTHDQNGTIMGEKHSSRVVVAFCRPIIITVMTASTLLFSIHTIYQAVMHAWPKHSVKTDIQAVTEKNTYSIAAVLSLWIHVSASLLRYYLYFLPSLKGKPIHDLLTRCTYSFISGNQLMYSESGRSVLISPMYVYLNKEFYFYSFTAVIPLRTPRSTALNSLRLVLKKIQWWWESREKLK